MTNQQILKKAIKKAESNGWERNQIFSFDHKGNVGNYEQIIFNHDFAKALWGEEYHKTHRGLLNAREWEYHLQQMVIAEDPIKYLGENI